MSSPNKRQGMAIASLILGVLSMMCFGLLTGIPAIILGHMAYSRSRKNPEQYTGGGLAIAGFVLGYVSIVTTMILAGMLLPALAKAKGKTQSIACINNLKNIGLAFRIYATDNQDRFPFNLSTNASPKLQTEEKGDKVEEPLDHDLARIFQRLAPELGSPKLLICPADSSKHPAASMASVGLENISYELEIAADVNETNPQEVLARCPIHGHELLCDGSVHQRRRW